jgi:hypothetical protein
VKASGASADHIAHGREGASSPPGMEGDDERNDPVRAAASVERACWSCSNSDSTDS